MSEQLAEKRLEIIEVTNSVDYYDTRDLAEKKVDSLIALVRAAERSRIGSDPVVMNKLKEWFMANFPCQCTPPWYERGLVAPDCAALSHLHPLDPEQDAQQMIEALAEILIIVTDVTP
jgi:hypothetical protein